MKPLTKRAKIRDYLLGKIGNTLADRIDALDRSTGRHHVTVFGIGCNSDLTLRFLPAVALTGHSVSAVRGEAAELAVTTILGGRGADYYLLLDAADLTGPAWFTFVRPDGVDSDPGLVEAAEAAGAVGTDLYPVEQMARLGWVLAMLLSFTKVEFVRVVEAVDLAGVEGRVWVGGALEAYLTRPDPETPPADVAFMEFLRGAALDLAHALFMDFEDEDAYTDGLGEPLQALSRRTGAPPAWLVRCAVMSALYGGA
jgi:hypothetical protein